MKKYIIRALLSGIVVILALAGSGTPVHSQTITYNMVAETGTLIDGYGPVESLGTGPSINDVGKVSFMGWDTTFVLGNPQDNRVFLENSGTIEINFVNTDLQKVARYTQVNDNDQIAWQDYTVPDDRTRIRRLDDPLGGIVLGTGSVSNTSEQFQLVIEWPSINDFGYGTYGADLHAGGGTVLALYDATFGTVTTTGPLSGFPEFSPMMSNDNQTIVRGGVGVNSPIVLFTDETLNNSLELANQTEFTALGNRPGISDDGRVGVFTGNHTTAGEGLYLARIISPTQFARSRIAGLGINTDLDKRASVNLASETTPNDYIVTYFTEAVLGHESLYMIEVNVDDDFNPVVGTPQLLAEEGAALDILGETVTDLDTYDAVNNRGEIVFWVQGQSGKEAIVRVDSQGIGGVVIYGDVNDDTNITSIDASQTARHAVGLITLDAHAQIRADVSGDGNISSIDASQIARFAVGLITCFPVEPSCP